jgi:hypothetical protein
MSPDKYIDTLGTPICVGDTIAYTTMEGRIQFGRVLELSQTQWTYSTGPHPTLKVQGSRRSGWDRKSPWKKLDKVSTLSKLENVLVINQHLPAMMTLV